MRIVFVSSTQWLPGVGDVAEQVAASWQEHAPADSVCPLRFSDGGPGFGNLPNAAAPGFARCVDVSELFPHSDESAAPAGGSSYTLGLGLAHACEAAATPLLLGLPPTQANVSWADAGAGLLAGLADGFGIGQDPRGADTSTAKKLLNGGTQLTDVTSVDLPDLLAVRTRLHAAGLVAASRSMGPLLGLGGLSASLDHAGRLDSAGAHQLERALGNFAHVVAGALGKSLLGHNLLAGPLPGVEQATDDGVAVSVRARELTAQPGAGSYGGVGFMLNVLGVPIRSALEVSAECTELEAALDSADVVVVVSTALDAAEVHDGTTALVAARALQRGVPVIAVTGHSEAGRREWAALGVSSLYECADSVSAVGYSPDVATGAAADEQQNTLHGLLAKMPGIVRTWSR